MKVKSTIYHLENEAKGMAHKVILDTKINVLKSAQLYKPQKEKHLRP